MGLEPLTALGCFSFQPFHLEAFKTAGVCPSALWSLGCFEEYTAKGTMHVRGEEKTAGMGT